MSNFVESLTKIKEDKVSLFSGLHTLNKLAKEHGELCLAGPVFQVQRECFVL